MKGNNILTINEATMIEIVQEWLDVQMPDNPPLVTGVKLDGPSYERGFTVSLSEKPDSPNG